MHLGAKEKASPSQDWFPSPATTRKRKDKAQSGKGNSKSRIILENPLFDCRWPELSSVQFSCLLRVDGEMLRPSAGAAETPLSEELLQLTILTMPQGLCASLQTYLRSSYLQPFWPRFCSLFLECTKVFSIQNLHCVFNLDPLGPQPCVIKVIF